MKKRVFRKEDGDREAAPAEGKRPEVILHRKRP